MDTQILFYGTIILTALMGVVLGYVAISYRKLIEKYERIRQSQEQEARLIEAQKTKTLEEGRLQAQKIISDAQARASQLVSEAATFSSKAQEVLGVAIKKAEEAQLGFYQQALSETKRSAQASLGGIPKDVKDEVVRQLDAVRASLEEEIRSAQIETKKMLAASYSKMEEEIEAYKQQRLKAIDEKIIGILEQVSTRVVGRVLSFEDHEEAILKALEDAKKENVL